MRDLRQIVLIHSRAPRCWSCFSSRSIFPHTQHTLSYFSTSARSLRLRVFLPHKTFSHSRARGKNRSERKSVVFRGYSSVVGCSGAVQVSGRFIGRRRRAAAFRRAVSREWSSVKWTEPFEPANTRTRITRRGDPEQSPAMDVVVVVVGALFSSNATLSTQTHSHQNPRSQ